MVTHRRTAESGSDFYPTPRWGTEALLRHVSFHGPILEPCCGDGAMSEVLIEHGYIVGSSDKYDRGYGEVCDFFDVKGPVDNIVTNPPFAIAEDILDHALSITRGKVCLLLRLAFLESQRRYEKFYSRRPPALVLVFAERLTMYLKDAPVINGGTTSYAWFLWDRAVSDSTTEIVWIKPRGRHDAVDRKVVRQTQQEPEQTGGEAGRQGRHCGSEVFRRRG